MKQDIIRALSIFIPAWEYRLSKEIGKHLYLAAKELFTFIGVLTVRVLLILLLPVSLPFLVWVAYDDRKQQERRKQQNKRAYRKGKAK